jgi:hypothetical protein
VFCIPGAILVDLLRSFTSWQLDTTHRYFWLTLWFLSALIWSLFAFLGALVDNSAHIVGRVRAFASVRGYISANTSIDDRQTDEPSPLLTIELHVYFNFASICLALVRLAAATGYLLVALITAALMLVLRFPWTVAILCATTLAVLLAADEQDETNNPES